MDLYKKIEKIPIGASEIQIDGKKYLVSRKDFNQGKSTKVYAEELGGSDFISFNFYKTAKGDRLKPCEMPVQKVLDFLQAAMEIYQR